MAKGLDKEQLKNGIHAALRQTLPGAFEQAMLAFLPGYSDAGNDAAKRFADVMADIPLETLAEGLAEAIDAYVRNIDIKGKMQIMGITTTGTSTAQAQTAPLPVSITTELPELGGGVTSVVNNFILGVS